MILYFINYYVCNNIFICVSVYFIMCIYRLGEPDDISGVVAFLVSDDASYITGEIIVAAGGSPASRL